MKKRRTTITAVIMTAIMMIATAMPVWATSTQPDPSSAVEDIDLKKTLTITPNDINAPNVNFAFSVESVGTDEITAIPDGYTGYTSADLKIGVSGGIETPSGISALDEEIGAGKTIQLGIDESVFNATGTTYQPGIYRYKVTETDNSSTVPGMTYDDTVYYVDLFMFRDETSGDLYCGAARAIKVVSGTATKADLEFTNTYNPSPIHNVTVDKVVAGNQGDQTADNSFTFTIAYTTANGRVLKYTKINSVGTESEAEDIQSGDAVELSHGESFKLIGLAVEDKFKITETHKGYTPSIATTTSGLTINGSEDTTHGTFTTNELTMPDSDVDITFTNTKSGTVPTGIFLNYKPFWIMGGVAVVLLIVFVGKRKNRYAEEL